MKALSSVFRSDALLATLFWFAAPAPAANSAEATAAAKRHLAETRSTAAAAARSRPAGDWSAQLAACQSRASGNPINREKCIWSHCNGHWGEGACPPGSDWPPKFRMNRFEKFGSQPGADRR